MKLRRPARRALLVVHVITSAGWLGLALGLLALGVTAVTTGSPVVTEASYRSMKVFTDWLIAPISLLTLLTGLVLSLGTPWGLAQHRWVFIKFWMTLVTTGLSIFALRPEITNAVGHAIAGGAIPEQYALISAPSVSLSAYTFMTVISVLKPWGLTKHGQRVRDRARRRPMDTKALRSTA
ncbi:DUF2269 family protein [Streptomyces odontomachi]|uniref:DUF2269 family protein n=1 Tax=Streptomyces odontomachi TaxID=2944940 RepID=UPI0021093A5F|nr:DUF2269 family protein [Streptomyces sp. ODS25]